MAERTRQDLIAMADKIPEGVDAVFLPGKIHSSNECVYVIYMNWVANDSKGSFEIEKMDCETILEVNRDAAGDVDVFFELLPDRFQGRWSYADAPSELFYELVGAYYDADFIVGRDGDVEAEMRFLVEWAEKEEAKLNAHSAKLSVAGIC